MTIAATTAPLLEAKVLIRLTYVSRANSELSASDIQEILQQARANNTKAGITGALCFNKRYFLQTIEGSRSKINQLLSKLVLDERHHDVQILECAEIEQREWTDWAMNYATPSKTNATIFLKYGDKSDFNPYILSAASATELLKELRGE